jgi:hypothetical protein
MLAQHGCRFGHGIRGADHVGESRLVIVQEDAPVLQVRAALPPNRAGDEFAIADRNFSGRDAGEADRGS